MQKAKALIIDDFDLLLINGLKQAGIKVDYHPNIKLQELFELSNQYQILVVRSKTYIDKLFLDKFTKIKLVARGGAGLDGIDIDLCAQRGIKVINAPEGNRNAVAEHTIAMMLAWQTKLLKADAEVKQGQWNREANRGSEIKYQTIGIIGFGNCGKEVAKKLKSFGCKILANDIDKKKVQSSLAKYVSLAELCKKADIITLHIPFTKQNKYLVNSEFLFQLKPSSLLLNMSRGEILNTHQALTALKNGVFDCLGLDVIDGEQKNGFPLLGHETLLLFKSLQNRIMITPHVAGWTKESYTKISKVLLKKIIGYKIKYQKNEARKDI